MRQYMYYKAHEMRKKARKHKNGGYKNILDRWNEADKYRTIMSDTAWNEESVNQYDDIALEDHSYIATEEESSRNEK